MKLVHWPALVAGLIAIAAPAFAGPADTYPTRPVTIVAPFAAGGGGDLLARMLGAKLEQKLGKSFVVENKIGAGGVIGTNAVAKAQGDGYTLLMATSTPMAINVTLYKKLPYDPAKDFVPVALYTKVPFILVVNPALPIHSIADLKAYAKDHTLSYGSTGSARPRIAPANS